MSFGSLIKTINFQNDESQLDEWSNLFGSDSIAEDDGIEIKRNTRTWRWPTIQLPSVLRWTIEWLVPTKRHTNAQIFINLYVNCELWIAHTVQTVEQDCGAIRGSHL